ncbi:hypothetical protein GO491_03075 [Flavobacteriaceae bacterium Ap0902]|nr:hypothetical protein [Flavobacteriaceae bacterium Ap0902]
MSSNWAHIDYKKLAILLTPTFLRKSRMLAWLGLLVYPIGKLYDEWYGNRARNLYILNHNSQVCYLRKVLNDEFDNEFRRIKIDDGLGYSAFYIYTEGENKPKWLYTENENKPIYLNNQSSLAGTGVDFYVIVPAGLQFNEIKMRALVDFYRLASKRYEIIQA